MSLDGLKKKIDNIEQTVAKKESSNLLIKAIVELKRTIIDLVKAINNKEVVNQSISKSLKAFSEITHIKSIKVENFPEPVKEVTVKNFPNPVNEIAVKNFPEPVKEVTVKNPVDSVKIKNFPDNKDVISRLDSLTKAIQILPHDIHQNTQPVKLQNERIPVVLIDPSNGKPYKVSGGGVATSGFGGRVTIGTPDGDSAMDDTNDALKVNIVAGSAFGTAGTATVTSVSGSATSAQLLASTSTRLMATFFNDSTASLYLKFGTTALTTSFTVLLRPNDYYELPHPVYTGKIDGIWTAADGAARITELTA